MVQPRGPTRQYHGDKAHPRSSRDQVRIMSSACQEGPSWQGRAGAKLQSKPMSGIRDWIKELRGPTGHICGQAEEQHSHRIVQAGGDVLHLNLNTVPDAPSSCLKVQFLLLLNQNDWKKYILAKFLFRAPFIKEPDGSVKLLNSFLYT